MHEIFYAAHTKMFLLKPFSETLLESQGVILYMNWLLMMGVNTVSSIVLYSRSDVKIY